VKIELNSQGIREYMKSDSVKDMLSEHAERVMSNLGDGYEQSSYDGRTRVNVSIKANTSETIQDQYQNNTILKALKS
jgi:hypothetical protein